MSIGEFRNALRLLLNDAAKSGLGIDEILAAADEELHPLSTMPTGAAIDRVLSLRGKG